MNVAPVASTAATTLLSSAGSTSSSSSTTSVSGTLDQQKAALQKEIAAETQSNDDAQTKAQKLQDYNKQLQKVEQEQQQQAGSDGSAAIPAPTAKPSGSTGSVVDITV